MKKQFSRSTITLAFAVLFSAFLSACGAIPVESKLGDSKIDNAKTQLNSKNFKIRIRDSSRLYVETMRTKGTQRGCRVYTYKVDLKDEFRKHLFTFFSTELKSANVGRPILVNIKPTGSVLSYDYSTFFTQEWSAWADVNFTVRLPSNPKNIEVPITGSGYFKKDGVIFCEGASEALTKALAEAIDNSMINLKQVFTNNARVIEWKAHWIKK